MHKKTIGATALASGLAFGLAAGPASAAECGTPAKDAVYKTVTTPATDAVFKQVKVVDKEAVPGTPAVYEDVKVIDVAYQPPTPGTPPVEEVSHIEHRLVTPGKPAQAEVSHPEFKYSKSVEDFKTQYHFRKFTQTRTKAPATAGYWQEFSPTYPKTFTGPPSYPTDSRGKWSAKKTNGGPQPDASGVFQNGGGNGSWFYRAQAVTTDWSAYGPWTAWVPETHTSWQDSDNPLGSPEFHGSGTYSDGTKWERVWQARFDGQTREVSVGSHTEFYLTGGGSSATNTEANWTVETPGEPWTEIDKRKVFDQEATPEVPPVYEDVKVIDVEAKPGTPGTPAVEEVSHIESRLVTPAVPGTDEVSHLESVLVTPGNKATSKKVLVSAAVKAGEVCVTPTDVPKRLAFTGSDTNEALGLALIFLFAGVGATVVARRKS